MHTLCTRFECMHTMCTTFLGACTLFFQKLKIPPFLQSCTGSFWTPVSLIGLITSPTFWIKTLKFYFLWSWRVWKACIVCMVHTKSAQACPQMEAGWRISPMHRIRSQVTMWQQWHWLGNFSLIIPEERSYQASHYWSGRRWELLLSNDNFSIMAFESKRALITVNGVPTLQPIT
jgi:hypothetical protein